jgi:hypothetical protein
VKITATTATTATNNIFSKKLAKIVFFSYFCKRLSKVEWIVCPIVTIWFS